MPNRAVVTIFRAACAGAVLAVAACAASSHVMVGQARPPVPADQVHIYLHPPAGSYDEIAVLDTSSKGSFSIGDQAKTDVVMQRLKEEAGKLGANGVLLQGVGDKAAGSIATGYGTSAASGHSAYGVGLGSSVVVYDKAGSGLAIYVHTDQ